MQVNNVSNVSFQAHVPKLLKQKLLDRVIFDGTVTQDAFYRQLENVESWGYETSSLGEITKGVTTKGLVLVDNYLAPLKKAVLPFRDNLLDSFMALTKKDITNAQNSLNI